MKRENLKKAARLFERLDELERAILLIDENLIMRVEITFAGEDVGFEVGMSTLDFLASFSTELKAAIDDEHSKIESDLRSMGATLNEEAAE